MLAFFILFHFYVQKVEVFFHLCNLYRRSNLFTIYKFCEVEKRRRKKKMYAVRAQYEYCMHFIRRLRTDAINNSNNNEQKLRRQNFYTFFRLIAFLNVFYHSIFCSR